MTEQEKINEDFRKTIDGLVRAIQGFSQVMVNQDRAIKDIIEILKSMKK